MEIFFRNAYHAPDMREFDPAPPTPSKPVPPTNEEIARVLQAAADVLEQADANPFRGRAFRRAARTILDAKVDVADLALASGTAGLETLPGIGEGLAAVIEDYVRSGGGPLHYRGMDDLGPLSLLMSLPGIGPVLARRIVDQLHIENLEELEMAIDDGRLEQLEGFGSRRTAALREMTRSMVSRRLQRRSSGSGATAQIDRPSVDLILKVDAEYRRCAEEGNLRRIAPRRFNPGRVAWLPVMAHEEVGWSFRAMYSNSALAHALGTTRDWVVIFFEREGEAHQCTVVTETRGPRAGRRVIRGRERES
jgi:DNA polymerase (family X)